MAAGCATFGDYVSCGPTGWDERHCRPSATPVFTRSSRPTDYGAVARDWKFVHSENDSVLDSGGPMRSPREIQRCLALSLVSRFACLTSRGIYRCDELIRRIRQGGSEIVYVASMWSIRTFSWETKERKRILNLTRSGYLMTFEKKYFLEQDTRNDVRDIFAK